MQFAVFTSGVLSDATDRRDPEVPYYVSPSGLYMLTRVPQGMLNARAFSPIDRGRRLGENSPREVCVWGR